MREVGEVRVFGLIPAAGMSRRMGRAKQILRFHGRTFVDRAASTLLESGVESVVVVTRSELIGQLDLPGDRRAFVVVNDDAGSEMIDSIRMGLAGLAGEFPTIGWPAPPVSCLDGCGVEKNPRARQPNGLRPLRRPTIPRPSDGVMVLPCDLPGLPVSACRVCLQTYRRDPQGIVVGGYHGQRGHPIVFPFGLRGEIDKLRGGLDELLRWHEENPRSGVSCASVSPVGTPQSPRSVVTWSLVETGDARVLRDVDTPHDLAQAEYLDCSAEVEPGGMSVSQPETRPGSP